MEPQLLMFEPAAAPTSALAGAWVVVGLALSILVFLVGYLCGSAKREMIPTATVLKDDADDDYKKDLLSGENWKRGTIYEKGIDDDDEE